MSGVEVFEIGDDDGSLEGIARCYDVTTDHIEGLKAPAEEAA